MDNLRWALTLLMLINALHSYSKAPDSQNQSVAEKTRVVASRKAAPAQVAKAEPYYLLKIGKRHHDSVLLTGVSHFYHPGHSAEVILYGLVTLVTKKYAQRVQKDLGKLDVVLNYQTDGDAVPMIENWLQSNRLLAEGLGLSLLWDRVDWRCAHCVKVPMSEDFLKFEHSFYSNLDNESKWRVFLDNLVKLMRFQNESNFDAVQNAMRLKMIELFDQNRSKFTQKDRSESFMLALNKELENHENKTIAIADSVLWQPEMEAALKKQGWRFVYKQWIDAWELGRGVTKVNLDIKNDSVEIITTN